MEWSRAIKGFIFLLLAVNCCAAPSSIPSKLLKNEHAAETSLKTEETPASESNLYNTNSVIKNNGKSKSNDRSNLQEQKDSLKISNSPEDKDTQVFINAVRNSASLLRSLNGVTDYAILVNSPTTTNNATFHVKTIPIRNENSGSALLNNNSDSIKSTANGNRAVKVLKSKKIFPEETPTASYNESITKQQNSLSQSKIIYPDKQNATKLSDNYSNLSKLPQDKVVDPSKSKKIYPEPKSSASIDTNNEAKLQKISSNQGVIVNERTNSTIIINKSSRSKLNKNPLEANEQAGKKINDHRNEDIVDFNTSGHVRAFKSQGGTENVKSSTLHKDIPNENFFNNLKNINNEASFINNGTESTTLLSNQKKVKVIKTVIPVIKPEVRPTEITIPLPKHIPNKVASIIDSHFDELLKTYESSKKSKDLIENVTLNKSSKDNTHNVHNEENKKNTFNANAPSAASAGLTEQNIEFQKSKNINSEIKKVTRVRGRPYRDESVGESGYAAVTRHKKGSPRSEAGSAFGGDSSLTDSSETTENYPDFFKQLIKKNDLNSRKQNVANSGRSGNKFNYQADNTARLEINKDEIGTTVKTTLLKEEIQNNKYQLLNSSVISDSKNYDVLDSSRGSVRKDARKTNTKDEEIISQGHKSDSNINIKTERSGRGHFTPIGTIIANDNDYNEPGENNQSSDEDSHHGPPTKITNAHTSIDFDFNKRRSPSRNASSSSNNNQARTNVKKTNVDRITVDGIHGNKNNQSETALLKNNDHKSTLHNTNSGLTKNSDVVYERGVPASELLQKSFNDEKSTVQRNFPEPKIKIERNTTKSSPPKQGAHDPSTTHSPLRSKTNEVSKKADENLNSKNKDVINTRGNITSNIKPSVRTSENQERKESSSINSQKNENTTDKSNILRKSSFRGSTRFNTSLNLDDYVNPKTVQSSLVNFKDDSGSYNPYSDIANYKSSLSGQKYTDGGSHDNGKYNPYSDISAHTSNYAGKNNESQNDHNSGIYNPYSDIANSKSGLSGQKHTDGGSYNNGRYNPYSDISTQTSNNAGHKTGNKNNYNSGTYNPYSDVASYESSITGNKKTDKNNPSNQTNLSLSTASKQRGSPYKITSSTTDENLSYNSGLRTGVNINGGAYLGNGQTTGFAQSTKFGQGETSLSHDSKIQNNSGNSRTKTTKLPSESNNQSTSGFGSNTSSKSELGSKRQNASEGISYNGKLGIKTNTDSHQSKGQANGFTQTKFGQGETNSAVGNVSGNPNSSSNSRIKAVGSSFESDSQNKTRSNNNQVKTSTSGLPTSLNQEGFGVKGSNITEPSNFSATSGSKYPGSRTTTTTSSEYNNQNAQNSGRKTSSSESKNLGVQISAGKSGKNKETTLNGQTGSAKGQNSTEKTNFGENHGSKTTSSQSGKNVDSNNLGLMQTVANNTKSDATASITTRSYYQIDNSGQRKIILPFSNGVPLLIDKTISEQRKNNDTKTTDYLGNTVTGTTLQGSNKQNGNNIDLLIPTNQTLSNKQSNSKNLNNGETSSVKTTSFGQEKSFVETASRSKQKTQNDSRVNDSDTNLSQTSIVSSIGKKSQTNSYDLSVGAGREFHKSTESGSQNSSTVSNVLSSQSKTKINAFDSSTTPVFGKNKFQQNVLNYSENADYKITTTPTPKNQGNTSSLGLGATTIKFVQNKTGIIDETITTPSKATNVFGLPPASPLRKNKQDQKNTDDLETLSVNVKSKIEAALFGSIDEINKSEDSKSVSMQKVTENSRDSNYGGVSGLKNAESLENTTGIKHLGLNSQNVSDNKNVGYNQPRGFGLSTSRAIEQSGSNLNTKSDSEIIHIKAIGSKATASSKTKSTTSYPELPTLRNIQQTEYEQGFVEYDSVSGNTKHTIPSSLELNIKSSTFGLSSPRTFEYKNSGNAGKTNTNNVNNPGDSRHSTDLDSLSQIGIFGLSTPAPFARRGSTSRASSQSDSLNESGFKSTSTDDTDDLGINLGLSTGSGRRGSVQNTKVTSNITSKISDTDYNETSKSEGKNSSKAFGLSTPRGFGYTGSDDKSQVNAKNKLVFNSDVADVQKSVSSKPIIDSAVKSQINLGRDAQVNNINASNSKEQLPVKSLDFNLRTLSKAASKESDSNSQTSVTAQKTKNISNKATNVHTEKRKELNNKESENSTESDLSSLESDSSLLRGNGKFKPSKYETISPYIPDSITNAQYDVKVQHSPSLAHSSVSRLNRPSPEKGNLPASPKLPSKTELKVKEISLDASKSSLEQNGSNKDKRLQSRGATKYKWDPSDIIYDNDDDDFPNQFMYKYNTHTGINAFQKGVLTKIDNNKVYVVEGSYEYIAPDGTNILVTYTADENGFHPQMTPLLSKPNKLKLEEESKEESDEIDQVQPSR